MAALHKKASHLKQALQDYPGENLSSHASLPSKPKADQRIIAAK
jgi:hypothetical protein